MIPIYQAAHSVDAHLIKNLLEQAGIPAYIRGEYLQGALGEVPVSGQIAVCVGESNAVRAREIVVDWEHGKLEANDSEPADDALALATKKQASTRTLRTAITLLAGAAIGGSVLWLILRMPYSENGIDYNADGILDERAVFAGKKWERTEYDRNQDRRVDMVNYSDARGLIARTETDDNFDGRMENTYAYAQGQPVTMQTDADANGTPEYRNDWLAGVLYREEWLDGKGKVIKRIRWDGGKPTTGDFDSDGDGLLDTRRHYDQRDEIVRSEPIPASDSALE